MIAEFDKKHFSTLRKNLLSSLSMEYAAEQDRLKTVRLERVSAMTCSISSMSKEEVRNECKIRLKETDANLSKALTEYALKLEIANREAQKLNLPTLN